jgi:hypothetical protein
LDIWGLPIRGHYATYGGGGYIQELNVNFDVSNRTLNIFINRLSMKNIKKNQNTVDI